MEHKTKVKIAFLYYSAGLTQDEIAKKLGMTRQKVNAAISRLREDGVVTVSIRGTEETHVDLEAYLEEHFPVDRVIIAPDQGDARLTFMKVASVAAGYLDEAIENGDAVGVSWGRTLAAAVREMRPLRKPDCRVVQLLGVQNMDSSHTKSDDIVRALSDRLDCPNFMLYAPAIVSRPETRQMLMEENIIRRSFEMMASCNVGIFGIGALNDDAPMRKMGFLTPGEIARLRDEGFCGDIGMNPVRPDGSHNGCSLEGRLLNADMETIRRMDRTIAIASGTEKAEAVSAALRSGCVNTLIIDSAMAEQITKTHKSQGGKP